MKRLALGFTLGIILVGSIAAVQSPATWNYNWDDDVSTATYIGNVRVKGVFRQDGPQTLAVKTVATLPACGGAQVGQIYLVQDAYAPSYNQPLDPGGTEIAIALCSEDGWLSH